jgi:pimeloyl-ACP methyl ester carboxylesterase
VPLRLLVGSDDVLTPPRLSRRLAERVPQATVEVRVVAGAGHMLPLEQPQIVVDELRSLAATVAVRGPDA